MCICTIRPVREMSPRYRKPRNCGCKFAGRAYKPIGIPISEIGKLVIYRDELEAMKLCDKDGLTQEEAGKKMGVSRGTVQRMLSSARKKVAEALSSPKVLVVEETICRKAGDPGD